MSREDDRAADDAAVRSVIGGDPNRFRELVDRYQRRVFSTMMRMVRRSQDAEDLTQQAFLEAYSALPRFELGRPFGGWLLRIAINNCRDYLKSHKRREVPAEVDDDADAGEALHAGQVPGPEQELVRARQARALERALDQLDEKYRLPLILKDIEGLAYQEIEQALGLPKTTLKIRVVRARERLQKLLDGDLLAASSRRGGRVPSGAAHG